MSPEKNIIEDDQNKKDCELVETHGRASQQARKSDNSLKWHSRKVKVLTLYFTMSYESYSIYTIGLTHPRPFPCEGKGGLIGT